MKKITKFTILIAVASVLFGISCNKDGTFNPSSRIKTITYSPGGQIESFFYDSLGRISRISKSGITGYISFVYRGTDSIIVYTSNGIDSSILEKYKLSSGLVSVKSMDTETKTFTYNGAGFLQFSNLNDGSINERDTFIISGDNVAEHRNFRTTGLLSSYNAKQVFTYLAEKNNTVTNEAMGMSFLGKSSSNLINNEVFRSETSSIPSNIIVNKTFQYTYLFDSNDRVTKMIKTDIVSSETITWEYTYN